MFSLVLSAVFWDILLFWILEHWYLTFIDHWLSYDFRTEKKETEYCDGTIYINTTW